MGTSSFSYTLETEIKRNEDEQMAYKQWVSLGILGVLAISLAGCGDSNNDDKADQDTKTEQSSTKKQTVNVADYTAAPKKLADTFTKKNHDYKVSEIQLETKHGEGTYEVKGFDDKAKKEMKVEYDKSLKEGRAETEAQDAEDQLDNKALNLKDVKKTPKDAINEAKKAVKAQQPSSEWTLKTTANNQTVYKVEFEKDNKQAMIDAKTGKVISTENND